jgi:hypothetical protein
MNDRIDDRGAIARPSYSMKPTIKTYTFKRWAGNRTTVQAETVTFTNGGALVFHIRDRLVLAVNEPDWQDVTEVQPAEEDQ